jgi:hypothetical protein
MKKTTKFFALSAALALATVMVPSVAQAATPWPSPVISGDHYWDIAPDLDSYGSTDTNDDFGSQFYNSGILYFDDLVGSTYSASSWCTSPIESPGGITTDGADTIITCQPHVIPVGEPGEGLTATVEIRIIASLKVARLFYTIENTTGSDISIPSVYLGVEWENSPTYGLSSSGAGNDGSYDMPFGSNDSWIITTQDNSHIPSGIAWARANCDESFAATGVNASNIHVGTGTATTFVAGTSTHYAAFLQMETPSAKTDVAMNAAIDSLGVTMAARYTSFSPELSVGIPVDTAVEFWQGASCPDDTDTVDDGDTETVDQELAQTGFDDGAALGSGAVALALAALGILAMLRRRARI